jgi:hypothetical protein
MEITLIVEGLSEAVRIDIAKDVRNGCPRGFFRDCLWGRQFPERHVD